MGVGRNLLWYSNQRHFIKASGNCISFWKRSQSMSPWDVCLCVVVLCDLCLRLCVEGQLPKASKIKSASQSMHVRLLLRRLIMSLYVFQLLLVSAAGARNAPVHLHSNSSGAFRRKMLVVMLRLAVALCTRSDAFDFWEKVLCNRPL